jgi:hypothetical protein
VGDAAGQIPGWDAQLVVDPFPPAYLSDWETNPTIASLTVTNGTDTDAFVTIRFTVEDGSGQILLQGRSDPQLVPAGTPTVFNSASTFDGTSSYDPRIEDVIVRTGRFPEDDYTACITLTDESGLVLADNLCAFFSTFAPDPPYLLFPSDGETITRPSSRVICTSTSASKVSSPPCRWTPTASSWRTPTSPGSPPASLPWTARGS